MQSIIFFNKNTVLGVLMFFVILGSVYYSGFFILNFVIFVDEHDSSLYELVFVDKDDSMVRVIAEPIIYATIAALLYRFTTMQKKIYLYMMLSALSINVFYFTLYYHIPELLR